MTDLGSDPSRPRIGVSWIVPDRESGQHYLRAVKGAGGEAIPLPADMESWAGLLATLQGLVLTGGGDVDPCHYGETNDRQLSRGILSDRDDLELGALRFCLDRGLPVLGICRGFQVINVALGGSLLQDIGSCLDSDLQHEADGDVSRYHRIEILPGTMLAGLVGFHGELSVNSRHHQGLTEREKAPGLRTCALASDGIVEGLEGSGEGFLVGVECHPERPGEVPKMGGLFAALVARARAV